MRQVLRVLVVAFVIAGLAGLASAGNVKIKIDLPDIIIKAPPVLAVIPGTNIYLAPDIDRDLLYYGGHWYRPHNGRWFKGSGYGGPWKEIKGGGIPGPLLRMPSNYRSAAGHQRRVDYDHVRKNWKQWEHDKYWDKPDRDRDRYDRDREDRDRGRDRDRDKDKDRDSKSKKR